jgi:cytidylate kinase
MAMSNDIIITIGRQYGSGGREIGKRLANELNIPFYDKELLSIAAKESGIAQELFESNDEKPNNSFLYSLVMGNYGTTDLPLNHKIFLAQFDAIRKVAEQGPCVIVGRCADYALEQNFNCVNVFIHADMKTKKDRVIEFYGVIADKAEEKINKTDKQRAKYYDFYTGKKWGSVDNYDLTLNSADIGIDNCVKIIKQYVELKK